jgi:alpha/beta superfamily hydrolase
MSDQLRISSRDGLSLAATIEEPAEARGAIVLCHPHPQMGGTMNAPLLVALQDALVGAGLAVMRFNFRGVGDSEGDFGLGEAEIADALGAIDTVADRMPGARIALAGWSFGAAVALRTFGESETLACLAIAPPTSRKEGITSGAPDPASVPKSKPILVVCGANDEQVSPAACRTWAETAGARFLEVKGANHFFWARYDSLSEIVVDFFDEVFGKENGA